MREHFTGQHGHGIGNMMIKPIEIVDRKDLITQEKFWIAELQTLFPYGLNMDANFKGIQDAFEMVTRNSSDKTVYEVFNYKASKRTSKGGRKRNNRGHDTGASSSFDVGNWMVNTINLASGSSNSIFTLRSELFKLSKDNLKTVYLDCCRRISEYDSTLSPSYNYIVYIVKDFALYKLRSSTKTVKPSSFMVIMFANKLVEQVNLSKVLRSKDVSNMFPVKNCQLAYPAISYRWTKSIRSKVLNYKEVIMDPNYININCHCKNYPSKYVDPHHKHIVTGDLDIVNDISLRNLLKKGLSYHEQQPPNRTVAMNVIKSGIDSYINTISKKLGLSIVAFKSWKGILLKAVTNAIDQSKSFSYNNVLSKEVTKSALRDLQNDFVLTPIDKASNNIGIVCKQYYLNVMENEIVASNTFQRLNKTEQDVLGEIHSSGHTTSKDKLRLPMLYASVKMHKDPVGFRYITAGKDTILQNLSRNVSKCLKLLLKTANSSVHYKFKEIDNHIFIIDNRNKVIDFINASNNTNSEKKCISTWDFSTLYTKIPHDQLKRNVGNFIRNIFQCIRKSKDPKSFLCCSEKRNIAYYSKSRSSSNISFDEERLIKVVEFIIDNSYIKFHDEIFRQVIGIPMGTNCAPYLANIYLHVFEYNYIKGLISRGEIDTAKRLSNMFRYQDDCISINDKGTFGQHFKHIYPKEMILKSTNISPDKCTFLDLTISIYRGKFLYYRYDKRDDFSFSITNYPNLNGNIPTIQACGVYTSQLGRLCDVNMSRKRYVSDLHKISKTFISQGFDKKVLLRKYVDFVRKSLGKWSKFGVDMLGHGITSLIFKGL